jgi:hypothetical protein
VEYFPLCLESGSWVEDWYHRLPIAVQASWDLLKAMFWKEWTWQGSIQQQEAPVTSPLALVPALPPLSPPPSAPTPAPPPLLL